MCHKDAAAANAAVRANEEGYDACYNGVFAEDNPYDTVGNMSDNALDWAEGWETAAREIRLECDHGYADAQEDYDSGRWTAEDTASMECGPDLPMRNEAGEWM